MEDCFQTLIISLSFGRLGNNIFIYYQLQKITVIIKVAHTKNLIHSDHSLFPGVVGSIGAPNNWGGFRLAGRLCKRCTQTFPPCCPALVRRRVETLCQHSWLCVSECRESEDWTVNLPVFLTALSLWFQCAISVCISVAVFLHCQTNSVEWNVTSWGLFSLFVTFYLIVMCSFLHRLSIGLQYRGRKIFKKSPWFCYK